jgi:signal transduction histidine kinase/ActR/RegA family two-component response regulator
MKLKPLRAKWLLEMAGHRLFGFLDLPWGRFLWGASGPATDFIRMRTAGDHDGPNKTMSDFIESSAVTGRAKRSIPGARRVALAYLLLGSAWIFIAHRWFTDALADFVWIHQLQTANDLAVVLVTAAGLYLLLRHQQDCIESAADGRHLVEEELRWKTAFLEAQVDSALDGILVVDSHGKRILQNQRMNDLWKIPPHIATAKDYALQLKFTTQQTKNPRQFAEKVANLYAHPDAVSRDEIELVDGTILDRYSSPVRDKTGVHYGRIWSFRDITERRKLEVQLRQAQKLEAIGQLACGVAHDFNNLLTVILMRAEQLLEMNVIASGQLESAGQIKHAAQCASNLTRQLLLFGRAQPLQLHDLDLNDVVANFAKMLQLIAGESTRLHCQPAPQSLWVNADAGMIDQILLNLAVNARDAMPTGGRLLIQTSTVEFDAVQAAKIPRARPGLFACLDVSDTGCGISSENLAKIFEPFFTTKAVGKGTGLGLAMVFSIVRQHQGWINVNSEIGLGTTFRIYLPQLNRPADKIIPASLPAAVLGGTETILLLDDEPAVRTLFQTALSRLGYRVLAASTSDEAQALWHQERDKIPLLLTDLLLSDGMSGYEFARRLQQEHSGLKVIYASGHGVDLASRNLQLQEGVNFLRKPFATHKLAQTVRNRLDQANA